MIRQESPQELKQLSIFDLFENTGETVAVLAPPKKQHQPKDRPARETNAYQSPADLFSSAMQQPYTLPVSNGNKTFNGKEQK
ncbi:hypothetical protein EJ377_16830 [Chryseobacterium arthrosphaerae]|uniref:Uncharacterized protein n=1 Tax=Chryseobacterium arthrosphaerae TaxID=651561 RepID=A0A432DSL4_9FLAO|nr:hypothetical protein EJ377_16830 [Chryseobacterium arthrosphaerae]